MALDEIAKRVLKLDELLREKRTGNIDELSEKLHLSRRQAYNYLRAFEKIGRTHIYNRQLQSFIYLKDQ